MCGRCVKPAAAQLGLRGKVPDNRGKWQNNSVQGTPRAANAKGQFPMGKCQRNCRSRLSYLVKESYMADTDEEKVRVLQNRKGDPAALESPIRTP